MKSTRSQGRGPRSLYFPVFKEEGDLLRRTLAACLLQGPAWHLLCLPLVLQIVDRRLTALSIRRFKVSPQSHCQGQLKYNKGIAKGGLQKTAMKGCKRLVAFLPLRLLAFVSVCRRLFVFARICLRPPLLHPLCVTLISFASRESNLQLPF